MNYFELYNLPISFEVDHSALKKAFLMLSKKYHPDFFTMESAADQEEALQMSTLNNKAYKSLKDFDLRMRYVLDLAGVMEEEGKAKLPQDFLMEMMDINEAIMDLQMDYDSDSQSKIITQIDQFELELKASVSDDLIKYNGQADFDLSQIKDYYLKKKYLRRIKDNLNKIKPEI